jgi:hypothetical protein
MKSRLAQRLSHFNCFWGEHGKRCIIIESLGVAGMPDKREDDFAIMEAIRPNLLAKILLADRVGRT